MASSRVFHACRSLMAAAKTATSTTAKSKSKSGATKLVSGFTKELPVSPAMKKFLGVPEVSRTDAVKRIWDYIKQHQLQDPQDKRVILCDDKLKAIFAGKDKVGMLEIGKLLSPHFIKPN